jgi:adenylate kinase
MDTSWILILLGAPGSGKGTQARQLSKTLGLPHISTGDILRKAAEAGTPLGDLAKRLMDAGDLVPDDVMCGIVNERLARMDCQRGFILDGFPRTIGQARFLDLFLKSRSQWKLAAFNIWVDQDLLAKRTLGRRLCPVCGEIYNIYLNPPRIEGRCNNDGEILVSRPDDNEEAHRRRQIAYAEESADLIDYYRTRDLLHDVDGNWETGVVSAQIYVALGCLLHEVSPAFDRTLPWSKSPNDPGPCHSSVKDRSDNIVPLVRP